MRYYFAIIRAFQHCLTEYFWSRTNTANANYFNTLNIFVLRLDVGYYKITKYVYIFLLIYIRQSRVFSLLNIGQREQIVLHTQTT